MPVSGDSRAGVHSDLRTALEARAQSRTRRAALSRGEGIEDIAGAQARPGERYRTPARRKITRLARRDSEGAAECAIETRLACELMRERQIDDAQVWRLCGCQLPESTQQVPFPNISRKPSFRLEEPVHRRA